MSTKLDYKVTNEFTLDDETKELLHRMYTSVSSSPFNDELAFTNYASPISVVLTNYNGQFVESIGKEGRGPGEIQSARYLGFDENNDLIILDKTGAFFKHYNRTSNEVISYDYPIKDGISVTTRNLQMCNSNWYLGIQLLGEATHTTVPIIGVYDLEFNLVDTLGGYDPFFKGRTGILQEPLTSIDCTNGIIYTTHGKVPYVQAYSIETKSMLGNSDEIPTSFMLSDKFVTMVSSQRQMTSFLSEEQSTSMHLGNDDSNIYHVYRNENNKYDRVRNLNESDHYVAVYEKENFKLLGEVKLPGAVLGFTKEGELIVLKDERNMIILFIKIEKPL